MCSRQTFSTPQDLALALMTHPAVYTPAEDSFLLCQALTTEPSAPSPPGPLEGLRLLDVGGGTGICGIWAALHGAQVIGTDLNPHAVELSLANAEKLGLTDQYNVFRGDLFAALPSQVPTFDLIICNPPYLPEDEDGRTADTLIGESKEAAHWQALALEAGPTGSELVEGVLKGAKRWLTCASSTPGASEKGRELPLDHQQPMPGVYLLVSSLTQWDPAALADWRYQVVLEQTVGPFERLKVVLLRP